MSKKRFSEGLNDLFSTAHHDDADIWSPAGTDSEAVPRPAVERRVVGKNFMADLDSLLQEALSDFGTPEPRFADTAADLPTSGKTKSRAFADRPPLGGLDALIRQTVDVQEIATDEAAGKKRLTVAVDKNKLDKLKTIARLENSYLKDLLAGLIDEYIVEYKQRKGIDL
jgi:hypothetical protein